jgi:hypothetical protein
LRYKLLLYVDVSYLYPNPIPNETQRQNNLNVNATELFVEGLRIEEHLLLKLINHVYGN